MSKKVIGVLLLVLFAFKVPRLMLHGFYLSVILGLSLGIVYQSRHKVEVCTVHGE